MPRRRLSVSVVVALLAWAAIIALAVLRFTAHHASRVQAARAPRAATKFSHIYPVEPSTYERPAVGAETPIVPAQDRIGHQARLRSLTALAATLPPHTLVRTARRAWRLNAPVELQDSAALTVTGPGKLTLADGAFVVAESDARLTIRKMAIVAENPSHGRTSRRNRRAGFLVARSGAALRLRGDRISGLGHLGAQAYGITLDGASAHSAITRCVIRGDYFGVYLARMHGGRVVGNHIYRSTVYGIDPHTYNRHLLIAHNVVRDSGVHGIILADHTSSSRVIGNRVIGAADHGLVIYQRSNGNVIADNVVSRTFDGIVLTDSSRNVLRGNRVRDVHRFAIRLSGHAVENRFTGNTVGPAIVGCYMYAGASGNRLRATSFVDDYENVRIRADAPGNVVVPRPPRSEIG